MAKFRKKPVVIDAVQCLGKNEYGILEQLPALPEGVEWGRNAEGFRIPVIATREGAMAVSSGDYVIRGVAGEFYPCKPDIFLKTHDPA